jgi:hypothetical protein
MLKAKRVVGEIYKRYVRTYEHMIWNTEFLGNTGEATCGNRTCNNNVCAPISTVINPSLNVFASIGISLI